MTYHKNRAKINVTMCIAGVLLCLTLFSSHFMGGLYARYTTRASGDDDARVITFGALTLTETGDFYADNKLMIIPGVPITKKAVVDFKGSESATYVFVEVIAEKWTTSDKRTFTLTQNSKTAMQWSVADDWKFLKIDDGSYIYYRSLAPNTPLIEAEIIKNSIISVSNTITKHEINFLDGVSIKFRATVVQSGGFDSPEAAWDSVSSK